jgi:hypothetical protein
VHISCTPREMAVGKRNIYVRGEDKDVWDRAEKVAGEASTSGVITQSLRAYVRSREGHPMERLTFQIEIGGEEISKAFVGRWLIEPGEGHRSEHESDDLISGTQVAGGTTFAVAETAKGKILILTDFGRGQSFEVFDDFDEAEEAGVPDDVIAVAANRAGIVRAELRDV